MPAEFLEELPPLRVCSESPAPAHSTSSAVTALSTAALAASLAACGGGGGASSSPAPAPPPPLAPTEAQASRFLAQASMGANRSEIANVVSLG